MVNFFRLLLLFCAGFTLLSHEVLAHTTTAGNRYYGYVGMGTGFGGFYGRPSLGYNYRAEGDKVVDLEISNGLSAGGFTGLLHLQTGMEWRFVNHLYIAAEVNGNVAFNGQTQYATTGYMESVSTDNEFKITIESTQDVGSNAFAGTYLATKIGWTDSLDSFAGYFILGVGYSYMPNTVTSTDKIYHTDTNGDLVSDSDIYSTYNLALGGARVQYGVGCNYFFNDNFGIYLNFIMASPLSSATLSYNTTWVNNNGNITVTDKDPVDVSLRNGFTLYSYFVTVGLMVRF
ncbi:MAG: hypothetical protein JJW01_01755 [Alphaproteobacteria bacterium]|nr:hypothetical protein [Rickettsiales bacterium]